MCRPSKNDDRCVDLRRSMVSVSTDDRCEIMLLHLLKTLYYIVVCELHRGFALQCFNFIETGILTKKARVEIVDSLATFMLVYTSRPTPHDFTTISRRLIEKYPILRDKVDNGYVRAFWNQPVHDDYTLPSVMCISFKILRC